MKNHPWATISLVVGTLRGARSRFLAFALVTEWGDFAPLFSREGFVMARQLRGQFPDAIYQVVTRGDRIFCDWTTAKPLVCCTQTRLLEFDLSGKIVREFTGSDYPELNFTNACSLQELRDGSILVNNFLWGKLEATHTHSFCQRKRRSVGRSLTTRTLPQRFRSG